MVMQQIKIPHINSISVNLAVIYMKFSSNIYDFNKIIV